MLTSQILRSRSLKNSLFTKIEISRGKGVCQFLAYLFLFCILNVSTVCAESASSPYNSDAWHTLLHYQQGRKGTFASSIQDQSFFVSREGRFSPQAEYEALAAELRKNRPPTDHGAQCRFPARSIFVARQEGLDYYPEQCPKVAAFLNRLAPQSATLVFPAPQTRGAGTLFGHILIRFNSASRPALLDMAISYAAKTEGAGLASLLYKGVSGGFNGHFSVTPYYQKLHSYRAMEERDIWEYPLRLNHDEVVRMALHAFELREIVTPYYFFDDNCAYLMASLIDVAKPSLAIGKKLHDRVRFWVTPIDVVHELYRSSLLEDPRYEPSLAERMHFFVRHIPHASSVKLNRLLALGDKNSLGRLSEDETVLARAVTEYRFSRLAYSQEKANELLDALSRHIPVSIPSPPAPQEGHGSGMASLGVAFTDDMRFLLGLRPVYHTQYDNQWGYPRGARLTLGEVVGSFDSTGRSRIEQLKVAEIVSLVPVTPFTHPASWLFSIEGVRQGADAQNHNMHAAIQAAGGISTTLQESLLFGLIGVTVRTQLTAGYDTHVEPGILVGLEEYPHAKGTFGIRGLLAYTPHQAFRGIARIEPYVTYIINQQSTLLLRGNSAWNNRTNQSHQVSLHYQWYF